MEEKKLALREEIDDKFKWKIEDMVESDEAFEKSLEELKGKVSKFKNFKGTLSESRDSLLAYLKFDDEFFCEGERLYVYANQKLHEDLSVSKYQKYAGDIQNVLVMAYSEDSFARPELLSMDEKTLREYMEGDGDIKIYHKLLSDLIDEKEHVLSFECEEILAKAGRFDNAGQDIYSMFNGADIDFPEIKDENGESVKLSNGRYVKYLESTNREVRKEAFAAMYKTYGALNNTIAAMFNSSLSKSAFYSDVRKYKSSRNMYLTGNHIPEEVYDNLIDVVHEKMPLMYKYLELRKKALNLSELHMYDLYAPMAANVDNSYSYDEAKAIVKDALMVMGDEYISHLEAGFNDGWIDVYENKGKRSGAYSWGCYGVHPYVLLNYSGNLNSVFTLAHEMGHAIHTYYSNENQEYINASYKIFVAEVASTCNEALLINYLLNKTTDKNERIFLINYFLEQFKGTLYRQTMFAEFEKIVHEKADQGLTLTADELNEIYYDLNKLYFGDGIVIDDDIKYEWSRIPHFYNAFYVYQYATGFSAAIALSKKILNEGESAVEDYKKFLKGGCSKDPIDLLKIAGVDMSKKEPIIEALNVFEELLNEMEELLK